MAEMTSWQVGVAAEAAVSMLFARAGWNVSVQYGANQPEYDLVVVREGTTLKVSVWATDRVMCEFLTRRKDTAV
jgi:hypothetical protein